MNIIDINTSVTNITTSEFNTEVNETQVTEKSGWINDELFWSPIQNYAIFKRFPYSLLYHILLAVWTSMQILVINTSYPRSQERVFHEIFIDSNDKTGYDYQKQKYLYTIEEIYLHLKQSMFNFYNFPNIALEETVISSEYENPIISASFMKVLEFTQEEYDARKYQYKWNRTSWGPFDNWVEARGFIDNITAFTVNYTYVTFLPFYYADFFDCNIWQINQIYSFKQRAHFKVTLNIKRSNCDNSKYYLSETLVEYIIAEFIWWHVLVIIIATISLYLTLKHVYIRYKIYKNWKKKLKVQTYKIKKSYFIEMWSVTALWGNILQIFGCGISIFDTDNTMSMTEITVTLGCAFAYLNIGKYIENLNRYSAIFLTIQHVWYNALHYIFGVLPIFIGFAMFGTCVFWQSERFASLSSSIASLYAVMNGDSVLIIIDCWKRQHFFMGQWFIYSFSIIFIVIVMNTFFSIVGEAYVGNRNTSYKHWIFSLLRKEGPSASNGDNWNQNNDFNNQKNGSVTLNNDDTIGNKVYNEIESVVKNAVVCDKIGRIIHQKSTTKIIVQIRAKFNERWFNDVGVKIEKIKRKLKE